MIKFRPPGATPKAAGGIRKKPGIEVGHDHRVIRFPGFGEDASVGIEDHGVAGSDFIIIDADTIAEDEEDAVVVGAAGKPAHEPGAAFISTKFALDAVGIGAAIIPQAA